jgi:hypothetical protein
MFRKLSIIVFVLVLGLAGLSNAAVIGFQAESGTLGADFDPPQIDPLALGGQYITIETTAGGGSPGSENRIATYTVTFPEAGTYTFYARLLVEDQLNPQGAPDNDSMFYARGFGTKTANSNADWVQCNGLDMNPFDEYGWFNLTEAVGYGAAGISFEVPAGELTQTFQVGAREDGLRMDAFVFSTTSLTDEQLDAAVPQETKAFGAEPADGSLVSETSVVLSWQSGAFATEHHVYFSANINEVSDRTQQADKGLITGLTYTVSELVPGTIYYWAVDEVSGSDIWLGDVWSFQIESETASNPDPYDGDISIDPDVVLSWSPGISAVSHKIYLDTVRENVEARSGCMVDGVDINVSNYSPGPLDFVTTYYWAVDEIGGAPDNATYTGEVWSFATMPDIQISDDSLVGWWTFDEGAGSTALDWSGHGNHGTIHGDPDWIVGYENKGNALSFDGLGDYVDCGNAEILDFNDQITVAAWIRVNVFEQTDQAIVSKGENAWKLVRNGLTANELRFDCGNAGEAIGATNVNDGQWHHALGMYNGSRISLYVDGVEDGYVDTINALTNDPNLTVFIGDNNRPGAGPQAWNGLIDDVRIYNKALNEEEIELIMRGNLQIAWNPKPSYDSTVIYLDVFPLTWSPGENAVQHDVYLGLDMLSVVNADTSTGDIYQGRRDVNSFDGSPETIVLGQTYYWRIDEINSDQTISKGSVWMFTVPDYLLVDDFESYNDINEDLESSNRIYMVWSDGYANPTVNGSTIGYPAPDFANGEHFVETDAVHGGNQSGPLVYDTTVASYAEVTLPTSAISLGSNWVHRDFNTLSIWFYGDPNNTGTEQLYVKLNNSKVLINSVDLTLDEWQNFQIPLADFGISLTNVTQLVVGLDKNGAGSEGILFMDDIRLVQVAQ